ncbi:hypothetical protein [Streptomyces sp. NPDC058657]
MTRTVLPSPCRTTAAEPAPVPVMPVIGGDELRLRVLLRQRLDGAL